MINRQEILDIFAETGAALDGHFLLTSGKHSAKYMQCAKLFQYPLHSKRLCAELASRFNGVDLVIGPAMGGIIMAYEVAVALSVRNVFAERQDGAMQLRRGFEIKLGEKVLVCEDAVTTGGSVKEVIELVKQAGGEVIGVASIVDRSGGKADFGRRFESLLAIDIENYEPDACPLCKNGSTAIKPGSRK